MIDMSYGVSPLLELPSITGHAARLQSRPHNVSQSKEPTRSARRNTPVPGRNNSRLEDNSVPRHLRTPEVPQRKLILHFDVRNTVLVADSVTSIGVEEALNSYLTGVTWGLEEKGDVWKWLGEGPSLSAPSRGAITYYKHMEKRLVQTPSDRGRLRQATGKFTQDLRMGKVFEPHFHKALKKLEWNFETTDDRLVMKGKEDKRRLYHYILPSVFHVIESLSKAKRDFAVIIRTYGEDAPNVLNTLEYGCRGGHPQFPYFKSNPLELGGKKSLGRVVRQDMPPVIVMSQVDNAQTNLVDEHDMYDALNKLTGLTAYVDDFKYWQSNAYRHTAGKPLWLYPKDNQHHHIFFDDNFRSTDCDSIVDVRLLDTNFGAKPRSLRLRQIAALENVYVVQVDLLQAIENLDYFTEKVHLCEKNLVNFSTTHFKRSTSVTESDESC